MPAYDSQRFEPPAPVATVILRHSNNRLLQANVLMLLDSGADVSLVPRTVVDSLDVVTVTGKRYELIGFDGSTLFAPVVQLEMVFAGRTFRGQFLLIDQEWGILGRNVLNAVPILLDGPRLVWSEHRI